jgi:spermidine synthase
MTAGLLIFSYGLFSIAAQALLFREFVGCLQGGDISVGVFFASWFLWVALGAVAVYRIRALADYLLTGIELLLLGYLPAFILQFILLIAARDIAGAQRYALLPVSTIVLLSLLVNAPVSVITGMFFPIACRCVREKGTLAIRWVYMLEAAGSFAGGLGTTLLLAFGATSARVFLALALIVSLSVFLSLLTYRHIRSAVAAALLVTASALCLATGADRALTRYVQLAKWTKLLTNEGFAGAFQTPQAEYLYGAYGGQWVAIREGSVIEALPDETTAGRMAAISLCQNPGARNILVIGSGLGLCRQFLHLPQVERVFWTGTDSEYVRMVNRYVPSDLRISDERFQPFAGDIRPLLAARKQSFDIVIVNMPELTSSVLNRYYTAEFYRDVKLSLSPNGIVAVAAAGGENVIGTELATLGASVRMTLETAFSHLVLAPGDQTWFIASDSNNLSGNPGTLRDRLAAIDQAAAIFPPNALLSVYLPDRAEKALESYRNADLPQQLLINRDAKPLTHLYGLLLSARQSDAPITRFVHTLVVTGSFVLFVPILLFVILRIFYILKTGERNKPSAFDGSFMVFSTGLAGIGVVIVLMYLYQTRFGSLYLHIGAISSLFMAGLAVGAAIIGYFLKAADNETLTPVRRENPLFIVVALNAVLLAAIAFWPVAQWTHVVFAGAFVLCGLFTGCYFPIAGRQLACAGFDPGLAGGKLETADHFGAAAGGLLTTLILVPIMGTTAVLFLFIALILANVPAAILRIRQSAEFFYADTTVFKLRRLGYALFGIAATIVVFSNLLAASAAKLRPALTEYEAASLAGQAVIQRTTGALRESGRTVNYFTVFESEGKPVGYIFSSQDLAPDVRGFGGKMNLAVYVDTGGKLIDLRILQSNETPSYLDMLTGWYDRLKGRLLFDAKSFAGVDAVTGATVSSQAILTALDRSAHRFATDILGRSIGTPTKATAPRLPVLPDITSIYLVSALCATLLVIYFGGFWSRLIVLCANLIIGGIILNAQYSSEQIAGLLSLQLPAVSLNGVFLLAVAVPLTVALFGNVYCGYLCPFGALQELIGLLIPRRRKQQLPTQQMRIARFAKYIVLFILVVLFFISRSRTTLAGDPLSQIFNLPVYSLWRPFVLIAAAAVFCSLFYTRFWCRYVCPVGAFLSLLNNLAPLKRYLPAKWYRNCEFGLTADDHLDCIYCDKCRYDSRPAASQEQTPARISPSFAVAVFVIVILLSVFSVRSFLQAVPLRAGQTISAAGSAGQPRDVDFARIEKMIKEKKLSDREADFYKKVDSQ